MPGLVASGTPCIITRYSSKEHKLLWISTAQFIHVNKLLVLTRWKKHLQWTSLFQTWLSLIATFQQITVIFHL